MICVWIRVEQKILQFVSFLKVQEAKVKIEWWDCITLKHFCTTKEKVQKQFEE